MPKRKDAWPLHLGSEGPRVRDSQWLLAGHNVFNLKLLAPGRKTQALHSGVNIDGKAGPKTVQAYHDAKLLLGYPMDDVDKTYAAKLRAYLLGDEKLPPAYRKRRPARMRAFHKAAGRVYPAKFRPANIGLPGQGTHSFTDPPNNWESDNAVDLAFPVGTPLYAISNGVIGPSFGPLDSSNPRFSGIRLHLEVELPEGEWYYAHLSSTARGLGPGSHVKAGQLLGKSGSANGAAHLHLGLTYGHDIVGLLAHMPLAK
jgi:murein DD-endopeptidase MepM/ murein hydrolase activator NlpD